MPALNDPCKRCGQPCTYRNYDDGTYDCAGCWTPNCYHAEGPSCDKCQDQGFYQDEADGTENYCTCQAGDTLMEHEATPCPPQPTALMRRLADPPF